MNKLETRIEPRTEEVVDIKSSVLFRPVLKQIGNSIAQIIDHFCPSDSTGILILPQTVSGKMADVHESLKTLLQGSDFFRCDSAGETRKGFVFLSESLVPVLSISTPYKPAKCDILCILPNRPVTVLTVVEKDISEDHALYNVSVARGTVTALASFLKECVNVVYGVLDSQSLSRNFDKQIEIFRQRAALFVTPRSLSVPADRFEKVVMAFWASAALTSSVIEKDKHKSFRLLTRDQCKILLENLDKQDVSVEYVSQSGATTLMFEIAMRLSLLEDTAVVCDEQTKGRMRSVYPFTFSWGERVNLTTFRNVVCDRASPSSSGDDVYNTAREQKRGKVWSFSRILGTPRTDWKQAGRMHIESTRHGVAEQTQDELTSRVENLKKKFLTITGDDKIRTVHVQNVREDLENRSTWREYHERDSDLQLIQEIRGRKKSMAQLEAKIRFLERVLKDSVPAEKVKDEKPKKRKYDELEPRVDENPPKETSRLSKRGPLVHRSVMYQLGSVLGAEIKQLMYTLGQQDQRLNANLERKSEKLETDVGERVHVLGEVDTPRSFLLSFPKLELDVERVNSEVCHVTVDGMLTNQMEEKWSDHKTRFRKYRGTCATSSFNSHLDHGHYCWPKYYETNVHGWVRERALVWRVFFEVGLSEESQLDTKYLASGQARSWSVTLADCTKHEGICIKVFEKGSHIKCVQTPMGTETDSRDTHRFGTVVDLQRKKLAFLDLSRNITLHVFTADVREDLYPVFGVWLYPSDYTVKIEVVSGTDVTMTDEKVSLVHKALS